MDALHALQTRNSVNLLTEPGPSPEQLENIIKAGLRACDHANLRPWKYLLIEGDARLAFGELMVTVKEAMDGEAPSEELAQKLRNKPLRAPTIIVVAASVQEHPKVPEIEQVLSAGAGAQMMMTAAYAQGLGAIWRSGALMFQAEMKQGLGLDNNDQIVGFLYFGTPKAAKPVPELQVEDYLTRWSA